MARDTSMLRDVLFDELDGLRKCTTDPKPHHPGYRPVAQW